MLRGGKTQGAKIQQLKISPHVMQQYARKKYEDDTNINSPLYESSVPSFALKCKFVTDRKVLALQ